MTRINQSFSPLSPFFLSVPFPLLLKQQCVLSGLLPNESYCPVGSSSLRALFDLDRGPLEEELRDDRRGVDENVSEPLLTKEKPLN